MANTVCSNTPCPSPEVVQIPGAPGSPGNPGTNGTNGLNAFSVLGGGGFVVPAIGNNTVILTVDQNQWMIVGQNVYVQGAGIFSVASTSGTTQVVLTYLNYQGNTATGNTIAAGAQISPSGTQPAITLPVPIVNGGTGAGTKANAQVNLGLGQNVTKITQEGISYSLTTTPTLVTGTTLTVPATGLYLIRARATVDYQGVTFGSNKVLTLAVVDTTTSTTLSTTNRNTGTPTTQQYPSIDYHTPELTVQLTSGDVLQLQASISGTPSAGTAVVSASNLIIIPLALS